MALAITDDHAAQESAFYDAPTWQRTRPTCANA
jgi:ParB family chromosome partitioning protein